MASTSSRPESPEVDFSVIRTSIDMGHKMIDQILYGIHYGSDEVRNLLREECDFILECKVCRNLFRSFPNFVAHKRVYCMEYNDDKALRDKFEPQISDEDAVIVQPEAPEDNNQQSKQLPNVSSVVENVINNNFKGKSKEYQFYTKVAEDVERRKVTKATSKTILTPLTGSANAVQVHQTKGGSSTTSPKKLGPASPKKLSPVKNKDKSHDSGSPAKKDSIKSVCANLVKKKLMQGSDQSVNVSKNIPAKLTTRSRKSSPRKSIEYMEKAPSSKDSEGEEEGMEIDNDVDDDAEGSDVDKKEWMEHCDIKNLRCKVCKKTFTTPHDLTFHVKIKHVRSSVHMSCPCCDQSLDNFTLLARHLKCAHQKNEAFINDLKVKLCKSKTNGRMNADSSGSNTSVCNSPTKPSKGNVLKVSDNLLSCTTGWKKCDKCERVFWKAKSYNRHYSTCKGPASSQSSGTEKASARKISTNNEAFMKLEEKLRAGVIQTIYPEDVKNKTKEISKEKNCTMVTTIYPEAVKSKVSSRGKQVDVNLDVKSLEVKTVPKGGVTSLEKSKSPIKQQINRVNDQPKITAPVDAAQSKAYNLRIVNVSKDQTKPHAEDTKGVTAVKPAQEGPVTPEREVSKVSKDVNNDSPGFKKLEERLVREAGLEDPVNVVETAGNMSSSKSEDIAEARARKISTETEIETIPSSGLKEQKHQRESPEIKQLMEKLTREALEPKPPAKDDKEKNVEKFEDDTISNTVEDIVEERRSRRSSRMSSVENKTEKGSEKLNESEGQSTSSAKRGVSRESNTRKDKTPEKHTLDINLSPVSSPGRVTNLPASPTPSMQSTDSYNLKFKMTVQEMAELVESASLTKFAKDRKKRARTILNKKQIKEAQKINPSLSKPMKSHVKKRNITIRNMYGTRNKGSPAIGTRNTNSSTSEFTPTSLKENQVQSKKLSREQKRLMNSAGFVEENFYAVSSMMKERHSDSDSEGRRSALERKRLSTSAKDHLCRSLHSDSDQSPDHSKSSRPGRRVSLENATTISSSIVTGQVVDAPATKEKKTTYTELVDKEISDCKETDKSCKKTATSLKIEDSRYSLRGLDDEPVVKEKSREIDAEKHAVSNSSGDKDTEKRQLVSTDIGGNSRKDIVTQQVQNSGIKSKIDDEKQLDSRHRTRLSTGSIFFDSELLTMSPTKAEKIVNDRNKQLNITSKGTDRSMLSFSSKVAGIGDKLKSGHQRTNSGPQRYSLATGVQQCQKCKRKFWKNSTYRSHMNNSSCSDKRNAKFGRKRALSTTPESKAGSGSIQKSGEVSGTKSKRSKGVHSQDEVVSDVKKVIGSRKQLDNSSNELTQQNKDAIGAKGQIDTCESSNILPNVNAALQPAVDEVDSLNTSMVSSINDNKNIDKRELLTEIVVDTKCVETGIVVPEEIAGPSGTNLSEVECHSDDDGSEFSGFSEDDLKTSELELSQIEVDEELDESLDQSTVSDLDFDVVSDDQSFEDDTMEDEKQSARNSKRPVRKSALNRFSHVEEIWVYKEPGKPVVEKSKVVKNREFVVDALNPSKLHCHNSKDVDRLIDEVNLKCKQCETPCTSISNLRRHVIRHLGWKRYKCRKCSFACYDMSNCRQHTSRVHDDTLTSRNFDTFITDLKREANCRRSAKRSKTIQKLKNQSPDDELYVKSKLVAASHSKLGKFTKKKSNKKSALWDNDMVDDEQQALADRDQVPSSDADRDRKTEGRNNGSRESGNDGKSPEKS